MALKVSLARRTLVPEWGNNRTQPAADQIRVLYRPLTVADFFALQQELQVNLMAAEPTGMAEVEAASRRFAVMRQVLEQYVIRWEGVTLEGADGSAVEVTTKALFDSLHPSQMGLLGEVYAAILNEASGDTETAGNWSAPSEPASEGCATPVSNAGATDASASATATVGT